MHDPTALDAQRERALHLIARSNRDPERRAEAMRATVDLCRAFVAAGEPDAAEACAVIAVWLSRPVLPARLAEIAAVAATMPPADR